MSPHFRTFRPLHRMRPPARQSGMALVITLSMVVLLTFVIVAFFSSATNSRKVENSSAGGVSARLLAEGSLGAVQAELLEEIRVGSDSTTVNGITLYTPKTAANMVPAVAALTTGNDFLNVIKQSGQPFSASAKIFNFPGTDSTAASGSQGRSVNPTRWATPMLTGAQFTAANAPQWIYISRNGTYSAAPTTDTIGRFAFNVYDVGGLLNANATGFAPGTGGIDPIEMPSKGSPVWADLRALPGINASAYASNTAWPPQWRITGNWNSFTSTGNASSLLYYNRTGWRTAFLNAGGSASDRMFASRQDLIRYAKAYPNTFTQNGQLIPALQFLTTFSRDLDSPSFIPNPDRPKVQVNAAAGGNDAHTLDDQINPSLVTQAKQGGEPAIKSRFSLARLSLVATPVPPTAPTADAADILRSFGLTWDFNRNCWVYGHGSASSILRLSAIPADRDPDFFETLKSVLAVGSLGKQFGFSFPDTYVITNPSSRLGGNDGRVEDQIVQIAANIIDQADADSFPTRIFFNGRMFFGIEDLPRIHRGRDASYNVGRMGTAGATAGFGPRDTASPASPVLFDTCLYVTMVQPELWNPHRPSPTPGGAAPANFRVTARSFTPVGNEAYYFWLSPGIAQQPNASYWFSNFSVFPDGRTVPNGPNCSALITYTSGEGALSGVANAAITFNLGSGDAAFREPRPLAAAGFPAGSNAAGSPDNPDMTVTSTLAPSTPDTVVQLAESAIPPPLHGGNNSAFRTALGFVAGYLPNANAGATGFWLNVLRGRGGPLALELQYQDPANPAQWWTMDRMEVTYANQLRFIGNQSHLASRADPRSERWGSMYAIPSGNGDPDAFNPSGAPATDFRFDSGLTANPASGSFLNTLFYTISQAPGWTGAGAVGSGAEPGRLQRNTNPDAFRYIDPDGVLRAGVARYASGSGAAAGWPQWTGNNNSRPVVLNRPFRSVAELGNVFRDTPWRDLDFMSPESGDRALLDAFTISDVPADGVVAGRINLNTRQAPVIAALIRGEGLSTGAAINATQADAAAAKLTLWTSSTDANKGPLRDRSELVGRFVSGTTFAGPSEEMANELAIGDRPIKASREAIVRALADAGTTRSWVFLLDVIAQSGSAPSGSFIPRGESRLWNSFAIDRFNGKILEKLNETIQE